MTNDFQYIFIEQSDYLTNVTQVTECGDIDNTDDVGVGTNINANDIEIKVSKLEVNTCSQCFDVFSTNKRMKCHMALAHDLENSKLCGQKVSNTDIFNLKSENSTCTHCAQVFSSNRRMQCHLTVVHEPKALKDESKLNMNSTHHSTQMKTAHDIDKHLEYMAEKFNCKVCNKSFKSKRSLVHHNKLLHTKDRFIVCDVCAKQFSSKLRFQAHKSGHKKTNICDICGSRWSGKAHLKNHHLRVHASEEERNMAKKFVCQHCPLRFFRKEFLNDHELVHLETKSHKCNHCGFLVKTKTGLRMHINGRHLGKIQSKEKRALYNATKRLKNKERTKRNGGLYRIGEERVKYREYMKSLAKREKINCPYCDRKTTNLDFHTKIYHPERNPPMFITTNSISKPS